MQYQESHPPFTQSSRLVRITEVIDMCGLSRSYIYALATDGRFPESIPLVPGGTSRAWVESEVQEWIDERIEARNQEQSEAAVQ